MTGNQDQLIGLNFALSAEVDANPVSAATWHLEKKTWPLDPSEAPNSKNDEALVLLRDSDRQEQIDA